LKAENFIISYEKALASQDWSSVEPLISGEACVTFSDGSVHRGKEKVKAAFERNFKTIKSEQYSIENIVWIKENENFAVYTFEYNWSGIINGNAVSGNGIGTSVIIKESNRWKLLSEHLGRKPTSS